MSVSTRLRFDIFKRDGFTCGYCGSMPPTVVLQVDHILAIANGGTDDPANLITSCSDCNHGKSDKLLAHRPQALSLSVDVERDRLAQLREYQQYLSEKAEIEQEWFDLVSAEWITLDGGDPEEKEIAGDRARAVRRFLKEMPAQKIIDALHTAYDTIDYSDYKRFKYFCGICWRTIKRARGEEI